MASLKTFLAEFSLKSDFTFAKLIARGFKDSVII